MRRAYKTRQYYLDMYLVDQTYPWRYSDTGHTKWVCLNDNPLFNYQMFHDIKQGLWYCCPMRHTLWYILCSLVVWLLSMIPGLHIVACVARIKLNLTCSMACYDRVSYGKVFWIMFEIFSDSFVYYFKYCVASH